MPVKKSDFFKTFKIRDRIQVYHVQSGLTVGHAFDHPADAKAFIDQIPESCCIADLPSNAEQKAVLRQAMLNMKKPDRVMYTTDGYTNAAGRYVDVQSYTGILERIDSTYAITKLCQLSSSRETGYDGLWLAVYDLWPIGVGAQVAMKEQVKLWELLEFTMTEPGIFQSACRRYRTASKRQIMILGG